ncbi:MAG: hypothetical protein GKS07_03670 [Nitrosopumilus sp.]|nr:MAG: hypothetical protein GKS07_03670 [Nitrosopumilus sp.]
MNGKIALFFIISLVLVIPSTNAQEVNVSEKANQKSVKVIIDNEGNVHVKHVVSSSNSPRQMNLIDGIAQNISITDEEGKKQALATVGNNDAVIIFPSTNDSTVEYDLKQVLLQKDSVWTWDFRYLQTTSFILPDELDLIFVNDRPIYFDDKKRGFTCHGCQMALEYSFDEPKKIMEVNWEDKKFLVEIRTFADIENFNFEQPEKLISFKINDSNRMVTNVIPLELLWGPYAVFLDDEKKLFHQYNNNGTHTWVSLRPDTAGEITIIGTTVVPEFPIIAPLAIGFLMILMVPFMKKFSLH